MTHLTPAPPQMELLDLLPVAVYACDKEGRITYFNDAAARLWGYRPEMGDISRDKTPLTVVLATGRTFEDVEAVIERPDGTSFHALVSVSPLFDEFKNVTGAIIVFRDITEKVEERRITAEALRKSEDRYHKMIDEVEDYAFILLDREGIIRNWNKGAEKIKGYKEEEIVGKSFREFYLPEDQESGLPFRLLEEAEKKGKALYEGWRKRKDGSLFWGSVVLTALHDDRGQVVGFSKVTRDLTTKKQSEDRMKEYLKQLEFQNTELEQFVYAASHDMKEPLRKIHLYNDFVAADASNVLTAKSRDYLARSIQATERMTTLIEDLLAYSKIATITEGYEEVDLNQVVDELITFHAVDFEQKRISVSRTVLPLIKGIPFQIKQLFANLVENAAKYRNPEREGSIRITAEKARGSALPEEMEPHRQCHKITVTDNGLGFEPANAARIFEIFKRLSGTEGVKGSGIGLAICKKIVQNHNGAIEAAGSPGRGASFSVFLPFD